MVAATLVESAVCTAFVLFAEDPQSLEISHSDLSDGLVQVRVGGGRWMEGWRDDWLVGETRHLPTPPF